jgi:hypothetical protein
MHFEMVYTFKYGTLKFDSGKPRRPIFRIEGVNVAGTY